ncbi:ATP-binding cassette domain-containing protein [Methanolobus sp. WCC5]|uniref:ABC transporter ATP-binding protein n=1 Tax=Methanolobus sp. WCC5 TaxID=3125785 RepID=UPI00325262E1
MEMLHIKNLSVQYDGKDILSDFDLCVAKGDKLVIKGRSGIGKSTLFRLIMGFSIPDSGTISLNGVPVNRDTVWDIRKKVAYVSQDTDIGEGTVSGLIDEIFSFRANRDILDKERLYEMLSLFSLPPDILNKEYIKLSGGEKQRITLIIALLSGKDIFLLDEVTAELDRTLKQKVVDLFFGNPGWTVLAISHDREWENFDSDSSWGKTGRSFRVIDFPEGTN